MPRIRLLKTGHGDLTLAAWDKDQAATVCQAQETFRAHMTPGRMAFRILAPGHHEIITEFDPDLDADVLIVPAITGG